MRSETTEPTYAERQSASPMAPYALHLSDWQDRGAQITQAAAQPEGTPRGPIEIGISMVLRPRRGIRRTMAVGSNGVGQFGAQTNQCLKIHPKDLIG